MQLIDKTISFQKPLIISTGIINYKEINKLYNYIISKKFSSKLAFLHCVSAYPTEMTDLNLGSIQFLQSKFKDCFLEYGGHAKYIFNKSEMKKKIEDIMLNSRLVKIKKPFKKKFTDQVGFLDGKSGDRLIKFLKEKI